MFGNLTIRRFAQWIPLFGSSRSRARRLGHRAHGGKSRSLRMEPLEHRELLSVSGIGNETFKTIPFTASGKTTSSFSESGYQFHLTGTANLAKGAMQYTSVNDGALVVNPATQHGALLSVNNGTYNATGKSPNFNGTWNLNGYSDSIVDQSGQLSGSVVVTSSSMAIPTRPPEKNSFTGTYDIASGTFNTGNFGLAMQLTRPDGKTMSFNGKFNPVGAPFNVVVTPTWNSDGTINVSVNVPGKPHTTANRNAPVANVQVYWAQGARLRSGVLDSIPVYWNEASGSYTVTITDYGTAPAGATNLAFVTRFDGKMRIKTLALPTVSVAATSVLEGNGGSTPQNDADFKVTLSHPFAQDVTVWFTTLPGAGPAAAKPRVDYVPTTSSIVIPAGQTQGDILVPVIGNTKYELNKKFSVKLLRAQNAAVNRAHARAVGVILNDDPRPSISIANATLIEPVSGTAKMHFVVTLSNASYQPIQVRYATANDTAVAGQDYVRTSGVLTFAPGQTTKSFNIIVKHDTTQTGDEDFLVRLFSARNASIAVGQGTGTGTITMGATLAGASHDAALEQLADAARIA